MKKILMTLTAVLCCAMTTAVFTSCSSEENHPVTYKYEVKLVDVRRYYTDELKSLQSAFNSAVGTNGTVYTYYKSNQDSKMKSACDAVYKKYTNINSVYMKFNLIRYAASVGSDDVPTVLATYEFGQALTHSYVTYAFVTNREEAYAALEAKKATLDEETYKASLETLEKLVGRYEVKILSDGTKSIKSVSSAFETAYGEELLKPWLEETSTPTLIAKCNQIADEHANDVLAVDVVVTVTATGLLDNKVTEIWRRTFPANVQ